MKARQHLCKGWLADFRSEASDGEAYVLCDPAGRSAARTCSGNRPVRIGASLGWTAIADRSRQARIPVLSVKGYSD
jgi:hypothetical protein